jgi:hypothetical protein
MKPFMLVLMSLLLSSCWPEYRQLDKSNNVVHTDTIALRNCNIRMDVIKKLHKDHFGDYHVNLTIIPLSQDLHVNVGDIKVGLSALKSGEAYKQGDIKFLSYPQNANSYASWDPVKAPPIDKSQTLDFKIGNWNYLVYSFSGHHHRELKLHLAVNINGETGTKDLVFKKFTQVELLH